MAIEIVPVKKENHFRENLLLIFSAIILLISLIVYFYLNNVASQKQNQLDSLNNEYATLAGSDVKAKENELALAGKLIGDFKVLYENNPRILGFFTSFQKWTHPKVVYSGFTFDVPSRKVTMSGSTNGFQNIMQQIAILNVESTIESYEISNINLSESGAVTFNLDLVVKPEVLK